MEDIRDILKLTVVASLVGIAIIVALGVSEQRVKSVRLGSRTTKVEQTYESQIQDLKSQLKAAEYEVDYWRKKACP